MVTQWGSVLVVHCINDNFWQQSSVGKFSAVFELLIVHGTGFDSDLELKQIIITFFFFCSCIRYIPKASEFILGIGMKSLPNTVHLMGKPSQIEM